MKRCLGVPPPLPVVTQLQAAQFAPFPEVPVDLVLRRNRVNFARLVQNITKGVFNLKVLNRNQMTVDVGTTHQLIFLYNYNEPTSLSSFFDPRGPPGLERKAADSGAARQVLDFSQRLLRKVLLTKTIETDRC